MEGRCCCGEDGRRRELEIGEELRLEIFVSGDDVNQHCKSRQFSYFSFNNMLIKKLSMIIEKGENA